LTKPMDKKRLTECVELAGLKDEAPEEQSVAQVCAGGWGLPDGTLPLGAVALQVVALLEQLRGVRAGEVGDAVAERPLARAGFVLDRGAVRLVLEIDMRMLVAILAVLVVAVCWVIRGLSRTTVRKEEGQGPVAGKVAGVRGARRGVATQSPVVYQWWRTSPRFQPLPPGSHGAWTE